MEFKKRKFGNTGLERRVRPRADPEPEEVDDGESSQDAPSEYSNADVKPDHSEQDDSEEDDEDDEEDDEEVRS